MPAINNVFIAVRLPPGKQCKKAGNYNKLPEADVGNLIESQKKEEEEVYEMDRWTRKKFVYHD